MTPRREEVAKLMVRGLTAQQIALELGITPTTVRSHQNRIYRELGVTNGQAAILKLYAQFVPLDQIPTRRLEQELLKRRGATT